MPQNERDLLKKMVKRKFQFATVRLLLKMTVFKCPQVSMVTIDS